MSKRHKCLGKIEGIHEDFVEFDYGNGTDYEEAKDFVERCAEEPYKESYTVYLVNGYGYRFKFVFRPTMVVEWGEESEEIYVQEPSTGAPQFYGFNSPPKPSLEFLREEAAREWE